MTVHIRPRKILLILPVILALLTLAGCQKSLQQSIEGQEEVAIGTLQQQQDTDSIDTSDWQTYTNEEFGFGVKYPLDWMYVVKDHTQSHSFVFGNKVCDGNYDYYGSSLENCNNSVVIVVSRNRDEELKTRSGWGWALTPNAQKNKHCDGNFPPDLETNIPFISCITDEFGYTHHRYFIEHNHNKYLLTIRYAHGDYNPIVEKKMLETFQFTDHEN